MKMNSCQTELPFAAFSPASAPTEASASRLDWPLQPLPSSTVKELQRRSARWSRRSSRRVGPGRIHHEEAA